MKTIFYYIRIYFLLVAQYTKTLMHFRANFFISTLGLVVSNITGILAFSIIFKSVTAIKGWNYYELVFIYAFSLLTIAPGEILFSNLWNLGGDLRHGTFIKYYLRPLNIMFYYMSENFEFKTLGQIIVGSAALFYSAAQLNITLSFFKILLLLFSLFSSSLIITSIMLIAASTGFWVINSYCVIDFACKLRDFSRYPISIYNKIFRFVFSFIIPIGFAAFYPSQLFLRPSKINLIIYFSPVAGIFMFTIAYIAWMKGVNSYTGTGS